MEETVVCIGLADVLETGMGAGLATARGLEITGFESDGVTFLAVTTLGGTAFLATGLAVDFAPTFATGLADFAGAAFATGFAAGLAAGFAATLVATFLAGLAGGLLATFATGLVDLLGLATVFPLGLATAVALVLAAAALLSFPDLAFTSCLLAEISCAWSVGPANPALPFAGFFDWASPARECTGFPLAKPIRCKIETIIWGPSH
ncbi:hypothetical protein HZ993_18970 [Rhodoferax sp. AJA081-3]|uniref:hypothetical protein n=1 Tax=Rhodoferax sp. AJA081-3 TaxID=2752316 RepID=UPI001AE0592B|nr:hypothetical protein [Rhodoferax sp. AJA081-3]QTN26099.1 hypothetical protein HZ993_18970 [Rhodoferax sp. AJA081-3]